MHICEYGCGQEVKYQLKNGKQCCSKSQNSCPVIRKKRSISMKGKNTGPQSEEHKRKIRESNKGKKKGPCSEETRRKISKAQKFILKDYKEKYPFLFIVEELRETKNGKIQVHCKNHECENSKEKGGWFIPTYTQLYERIRQLEHINGWDGSYFYCSQYCKDTCELYNLKSDPYKDTNLPYTYKEYQTFRTFVLERDNHICQFCGEPATNIHHERPQKLEPFYALDPDFTWSCCEKCHYEKGHKDECSTGNLSKIVCSVESQKFLNQ